LTLPEGIHNLELEGGSPGNLSSGPGLILKGSGFGGLRRHFEAAGSGQKIREGLDPVLSLSGEFSPLRGLVGPVKGVWEGSLEAKVYGIYRLGGKASGPLKIYAGKSVLVESPPHESHEREIHISGPVPIRVEVNFESSSGHFLELFWQKPDGSRGPVPEECLKPS
jgi:hypothetical protein